MESALQEDKDNIVPDDESCCSESAESGDDKEAEEQAIDMQPESSQDEEQRGRIGRWISTTTTTTTTTMEQESGSVADRLTPPPTPIVPPRLRVDTRMTGPRTPLFSIPEHEEEEEEIDGDDGVSGEMAALSITSASDSNALEMLGSPLPIDVCLSADGVADRLHLLRVDADLVDCGEEEEEDEEEDELMQANTNKQRKPFRDPFSDKKGVKRSSIQQTVACGEAGTASLSTQEIRRKVATTFRRRASGRSGGSSGGKGKNQSKSSASRNQRETIKASTATFWS